MAKRRDETLGVEAAGQDELEPPKMVPPADRPTPVAPPTTPLPEAHRHANGNGNGNGHLDPDDMQALIDAFRKLPIEEQTRRLLHLYLAIQGEDGLTRKDLANHKFEDRQEFAVINDELDYQGACLELLMKHFELTAPPRPKERPRRKE